MKKSLWLLILSILISCEKGANPTQTSDCNIISAKDINSKKVTINNGVWGTLSMRQGNCMPTIGVKFTTCLECPIKREVRVYNYTTTQDAELSTGGKLFNNFKTQLIKTVYTDEQGFFQVELPNGKYSVVFVEDGKLYANTFDGLGGISSVIISDTKTNVNLVLDKAVY